MKKISLVVATLVLPLAAGELVFDGLVRLSPQTAAELIAIDPSIDVDDLKWDEAIRKLYGQGYFEDIWVEALEGKTIIHVKEKPAISKVDFSGYGENDKETFELVVGLKKGDIYDEKKITEAKKRIIEKIQNDGYYDTVVETETKLNPENGSVEVKFLINKGEKITIERLSLEGAKTFSKKELTSLAANKEREWLGWFWGRNDGVLRLSELEMDSLRIREFYMQHGYLDAKVSDPLLRVNFDNYTADLDYQIHEGRPYTVRDVKVELSEPVMALGELSEGFKLKAGKIFNVDKLRKDIDAIKTKIADLGYAFVRITPDLQKDENSSTVTVVYRVAPGKKVYINDVIIAGNLSTLDRVVRREIFLAPGDLYNLTDLKESRNALRRTGFFEEAIIEERRVSEDRVDLIVTVKEALTGSIMVGGGYGSYDGLLLNAAITDRNVFGSGISLTFNFDYSSKQQRYDIGLNNPRFRDSSYSLGFNIYDSTFVSYSYTEHRQGGSVTTGKRFGRYVTGSITYQYVKRSYSDFTSILYYDLIDSKKSSIVVGVGYDSTDDYFVPRKGQAATLSTEFAGLGGDEKFTKIFGRYGYYYGLSDWIDWDLIFRAKARMGAIADQGYVTLGEKFYLGGISSLRGYQSYSVSPTDRDGNLIGGKYFASGSLELSLPVSDAAKMRLALFYDRGYIGEESITEISRSSYGAALEWYSPMGPIQLVFGRPLDAKSGDRTSNFEFTIGTRF
ncbi:MAG: outer membrane protein assembly factor BamA [Campylobacterales bacterium]